jgi:hypothetical protein
MPKLDDRIAAAELKVKQLKTRQRARHETETYAR